MSRDQTIDLTAIRARLAGSAGKQYWRSLDELAETDEFRELLHREFPAQASEWLDPVGRRGFLKLMGASIALAGATACTRQPDELIVPYVRQPEDVVPGKPLFFATTMTLGGIGTRPPGRKPHGASDQARRQPRSPLERRRDGPVRSGHHPDDVRPRSDAVRDVSRRDSPLGRFRPGDPQPGYRAEGRTAAPGCASCPRRSGRRRSARRFASCSPACRRRSGTSTTRRRARTATPGPRWPSDRRRRSITGSIRPM